MTDRHYCAGTALRLASCATGFSQMTQKLFASAVFFCTIIAAHAADPRIPKTWDDTAIASSIVPLAVPSATPAIEVFNEQGQAQQLKLFPSHLCVFRRCGSLITI